MILGRRRRGAGGDDPWYQLSNLKNDVMSFVTLSPPHLTFSGDCHVERSQVSKTAISVVKTRTAAWYLFVLPAKLGAGRSKPSPRDRS